MMKLPIILSLFAIVLAQYYKLPENDTHSVATLPGDLKEMEHRINCYLDKEPCNEAAAVFKGYIPESVKEACAKCSPYLKHYYHVFIETAAKYFPERLKELQLKYDPNDTLFNPLVEAVRPY